MNCVDLVLQKHFDIIKICLLAKYNTPQVLFYLFVSI